jgi:uncharacterized protein (DUF58 family)
MKLLRTAERAAAALPGLMITADKAAQSLYQGARGLRRDGIGEKFWQFREYAPGDRPQDIDWRQSAKTDRVFIRQRERSVPQTCLFWADSSPGMDFSSSKKLPTKFESAQVISIALAILSARGGGRVGALTNGRTGISQSAIDTLAHNISSGDFTGARIPKNSIVFLAGDFLEAPEIFQKKIGTIDARAGAVCVIQILDPAEIELPYDGRVIFAAPDGDRTLIQNVPDIRETYKTRMQDHIAAIQKITRARGWIYALHRTDMRYEDTLGKIWGNNQ